MCKLRGYFVTGNQSSHSSLKKYHKNLDEITPTWLELKNNGNLLKKQNEEEVLLLNNLKGRNSIIPLIQNYRLKSKVSNMIVTTSEVWKSVKQNLDRYLKKSGYRGINFNLEGVKKENKKQLNNFIEEMSDFFHSADYQLELSIPAKVADNRSEWAGAYEYDKLGKLVDRVIIMAYDYHWVNGPPGAIAPLPWVQDVIDYALIKISPAKIYLGVPCYGYDWIINNKENSAQGLSFYQVMNIREKYNSNLEWDQESQTPYLKYKNNKGKHEVWFENKNSILKKIDLVKKFQLQGAAFWRIGLEDPAIWAEL